MADLAPAAAPHKNPFVNEKNQGLVTGPIDVKRIPNHADIKDRCVVITGGANGLGASMVEQYVKHGARVCIGDMDVASGQKLQADNSRIRFVKCDVTSWQDQLNLFKTASDFFSGRLDIVCANAGITENSWINEDDLKEPRLKTLEINLTAQFYTTKLAHYYFRRSRGHTDRCLILTGSMASFGEIPGAPQYTASKHGMLGLMKSLRRSSMAEGIRVNSIHPWFVKTAIIGPEVKLLLAGTKYAEAEDVARAVMLISCTDQKANGRALSIMDPDVGISDMGDGEDAVGDFRIFMERVERAIAVRSKFVSFKAYWSDTIINTTKLLGMPVLVASLAVAGYRRGYFAELSKRMGRS